MAQGNDGFGWRQVSWGTVLVCEPLLAVAPHLFTTRDVDGGRAAGEPDALRAAVAAALGHPAATVCQMIQVHGTDVVIADDDPGGGGTRGDILVTRRPDRVVVVRVADCVPVLLADARTGAVAAVHAGWRGTAAGATRAAVRALSEQYGCRPADLVCAIGPSIGPCCYQVGPEVREAFLSSGSDPARVAAWFAPDGDRWRLDLWAANHEQLVAAGVPTGRVHVARHCTASMLDRYFSYRVEGAKAGRSMGAIRGRS